MTLRIGGTCFGAGGLDAAIQQVIGGDLAWVSEIDPGACKLIAHRFPDVPNLGDLKAIDWSDPANQIDVLTGGYPCQPFSHAGARRGTDDPRHLWPHLAEALETMRPPLAVFENVEGHLSLGFDVVLDDLRQLDYDAAWVLIAASDIGAAHRRRRLFILAWDRRRFTSEKPDAELVAWFGGDGWKAADFGLFGAAPFTGRLPKAGRLWRGRIYATDRPGIASGIGLLPTPRTSDTTGAGSHGEGGDDLRTVVSLLTTPQAADGNGGGRLNSEGHSRSLPGDIHELPTPTSRDHKGRNQRDDATRLTGALMPTPRATDGEKGGPNQRGSSGDLMLPSAVMTLPTPRATRGGSATETVALLPTPAVNDMGAGKSVEDWDAWTDRMKAAHANGNGHGKSLSIEAQRLDQWGIYAAAIERHASMLGRPAPEPTELGPKGSPRLSPRFTEWLMCWPEGWVTDVPDLSRNDQLRICGNGVIPIQAATALTFLLERSPINVEDLCDLRN